MKRVDISVRLPFKIQKKKGWFLASCPVLDVHSQGDTEEEAKKNLGEAVSLFLISCFERGTLDEVLKSCGFRPGRHVRPLKMPAAGTIDVSLPFLVNQAGGRECHG